VSLLFFIPDSAIQSAYYAIQHNHPEIINHEKAWNLKAEKTKQTIEKNIVDSAQSTEWAGLAYRK